MSMLLRERIDANLQVGDADVSTSNAVPTEPEGSGTIGTAVISVLSAGTPVQGADQACRRVTIQARSDNATDIVVGDSNVVGAEATQQGIQLTASSAPIVLHVTNTNLIYVDSDTAAAEATLIWEN